MPSPAELWPEVYDELRKLAAARLADEKPGQTIQATALVHEAWLRLMADAGASRFLDRAHFLRTAATVMRHILVDRARAKLTDKRGGELRRHELDVVALPVPEDRLLSVDEALRKLAESHPEHAQLVELRFFAGLTGDEAAKTLGISPASVDRMWRYAKTWLRVELGDVDT